MNKTIEFFFDFVSPFGWFAAERIGGIARAHDRNMAWKPLLLGVTVRRVMGLPAVLETPLKGPYLLHDAERCARFYGLPWRPPTPIMFSSVAAARAIIWAVARGDLDDDLGVEALVLGLYRRAWTEAGDISTPDAVAELAASVGFDRAAVRAGIECPETKAGLRASVADAAARGFFGSPFIVVDGEPFWGADRLAMVEQWLVSPW